MNEFEQNEILKEDIDDMEDDNIVNEIAYYLYGQGKQMKLIIDIDEETYTKAQAGILGSLGEIVANGIPYEPEGEWIPVSERLPQDFCVVLVYCPQFDNIYRVFRESDAWHQFSTSDVLMQAVTHWRPLPKAPESEDTNER